MSNSYGSKVGEGGVIGREEGAIGKEGVPGFHTRGFIGEGRRGARIPYEGVYRGRKEGC